MILHSYFHIILIPSTLRVKLVCKKNERFFFPRIFSFKMCVMITMSTCVLLCMNCSDFHMAFWHLTMLFIHPSLDSVSVLMFTALSVCLSYGTRQCYTLYTFKLCKMCVPLMPTHTQISILSGKLDFKLYITVPLRTSVIVTNWKDIQ